MRLLYFINSIKNNGGMERIVIDKINYLAELKDYEVALAYFGTAHDTPFFHIDSRILLVPMGEQSTGGSFTRRLWSFVRLPQKVKNIIDKTHPDVIVNANTILVSWLLPFVRRRVPKIVELHFSYAGMQIISDEIYGNNRIKKKLNYYIRKWGYPLYNKCVLLTEEDASDWGFKNAVVIPNFTNLKFNNTENKTSNIAVNIGRLSPPKNQRLLIDAWKLVHKEKPDWNLEIWGDGEYFEDLTNQIHSLGLNDVVLLKGVSHHIETVYSHASFFILSSRYEGHPLVLIEALQAGLPCVSTSVNGVRGTIRNGYNGFIVEEMTAESLAEGILKMISSEHKEEMSQNARESAKPFEKDNIMQMWIKLFEKIKQNN